jgi:hypothetical protein
MAWDLIHAPCYLNWQVLLFLLLFLLIWLLWLWFLLFLCHNWNEKNLFLGTKFFENKSIVEKERHNKNKAKLEGYVFFNYGQDTPECQKEETMATHPPIHPWVKQVSKP